MMFDERKMLALLGELNGLEVDAGEMHQLQVMFRHHGPSPSGVVELIAKLVHSASCQPLPALRGGAEQGLFEYEAGDNNIMFEVRPHPGGLLFDIHGQVFADDPDFRGASVILSTRGEDCAAGLIDQYGEFDFGGMPPGKYRVTWHFGERRIVIPEVVVGG